jgi:glycosyltransferase involved in cell wall biosynthesis
VLVNRDCPALLEHVETSGGGLAYGSAEEFLAGFRQLSRRPALRQRMGEKGLAYVKKYYSWDSVLREIQAGIAEVLETKKT